MKNLITILSLIVFSFIGRAQESTSYIIDANGEKQNCIILSHNLSKVRVSIEGQEKKYAASEIKGFTKNNTYYESGKVAYGSYGIASWYFLEVIADGKMNLYRVSASHLSENSVTGQQTSTETPPGYYVKKAASVSNEYTKLGLKWKKDLSELGSDCSSFVAEVNKANFGDLGSETILIDLINFYNQKCAE